MWGLSKHILNKKDNKTNDNNVTIGYFSISIANNAYIEMIKPALFEMLKEYGKIKLLLLGELILRGNFTNYINTEMISNVDINITLFEKTIFNQAKSENIWVEASLVEVPTIANNLCSLKNSIIHNETWLLCDNTND